jgi:hypothetical protein
METEAAFFSADLPGDKADALLCHWAPSDEIFTFPRRKAWYCCEPSCQFRQLGGGTWPGLRDRLASHEFLWHNHPDPRFQVPHVTHHGPLSINLQSERIPRAIAIVSNYGGAPWRRHPELAFRARLVTHPSIDLYGRSGWQYYRKHWYSRAAPPANYRGTIPGDWNEGLKRELMARYKVAVCLENMIEPHYFSEKFVEAVCAGCVPVYCADAILRETVLKGAAWVDPLDYDGDPNRTLQAALQADAEHIREINRRWLMSVAPARTSQLAVFNRLAEILCNNSIS